MPEIITSTVLSNGLTTSAFLICTFSSLILGVGVALVYMFKNIYSKSFVLTVALLPAIVQAVIMLVNGNMGTGIAVMGAFSLVRFRSAPGSAKEIMGIFLAMAIGLACGMGYIAVAVLLLIIIGGAYLLLTMMKFGSEKSKEKNLKITLPEDVDYNGLFEDLFEQYLTSAELITVKTANMGSLFEVHYRIRLKTAEIQKEFIDKLRCRNGNLTISCSRIAVNTAEL